ncbi:MAG: class I SAM-dependent methyltransferase [Desulfuromusa sp.]|nr:class I SAM-dependent methyltransferase [Desulfuromusa sp.]
MEKPEFDQHADRYDQILGDSMPVGLNEDTYFAEYKIALAASRMGGSTVRHILDYGCGAGRSLPYIEQYFPSAEIWGYDVSPASLEFAGQRLPVAKLFSDWSNAASTQFDLIISANVFHHIPPANRLFALKQCFDSLSEGGKLFLFEHNPYNPATRWIFEHCPFDEDAEMLSLKQSLELAVAAGFKSIDHGYTLFFPRPLAFLRGMEPYMRRIPLGAQYYVRMEK